MRLATVVAAITLSASGLRAVVDDACRVAWSEAASMCAHEIVEASPITTRAVKGIVRNGVGDWPDGVQVVLELALLQDKSVRHVANVTMPSGEVSIRSVPEGEYCFRVAARPLGW